MAKRRRADDARKGQVKSSVVGREVNSTPHPIEMHLTPHPLSNRRNLSSANRMVWELFQALRRLCARVAEAHQEYEMTVIRQDAALCVILAVQCVEVFFNVYFRVLASEIAYAHAAREILDDLDNRSVGLDQKIKKWPRAAFGKQLNLGSDCGQRFVKLKNLRHALMHFKSSHETIEMRGVTIQGLADTTVYQELSAETAVEALQTVEAFICEVFALRGLSDLDIPHALHAWTGKPPGDEKAIAGPASPSAG